MLTPAPTITQTGDFGGEKIAMGFHKDSIAHLMSLLTDLYSDTYMAVIREYSTNALDAHIEAGNPAPIEVFTPTMLSPYFRVVDHGVGLSIDDIKEMYSQYGASSKRGSNTQVGMLGIGAKSGLTISPQFNLTSVKNGVKIHVSVSRSAGGGGQMEIIDTKATTESNGVTISIPVNDRYMMLDKCNHFFSFWGKGTVLLNGQEPDRLAGQQVGSNFIIDAGLGKDYVVMGNVPYPVKDGLYTSGRLYHAQMGIVAFVDIGDVNFTPSREDLQYTPQTIATLDLLKESFNKELFLSAQTEMDGATGFPNAWKIARQWKESAGVTGLKFKNKIVPSEDILVDKAREYYIYSGSSNSGSWRSALGYRQKSDTLLVFNAPEAYKLTPAQKAKFRLYATAKGLPGNVSSVIVFTGSSTFTVDPASPSKVDHDRYFEDWHRVDWADIVSIKIARTGTAGAVRTDPYDLYIDGYRTKQVSVLDTSKPIVYYSTAEFSEKVSWMQKLFLEGTQIIVLPRNRWNKFVRDFPTALHYRKAADALQVELVKNITLEDKYHYHYSSSSYVVHGWDHTKIADPELVAFVKAFTINNGRTDSAKLLEVHRNTRGVSTPVIPILPNPLTKYPLAVNIRSVPAEHIYWYLNNFYAHLNI